MATVTQNSPFSSLAVAVAIASTHCVHPRRDGQVELIWVAGDRFSGTEGRSPDTVTHLSTNRARHRVTSLIKANALPLSQTATLMKNEETRAVPDVDSRQQQCFFRGNAKLHVQTAFGSSRCPRKGHGNRLATLSESLFYRGSVETSKLEAMITGKISFSVTTVS